MFDLVIRDGIIVDGSGNPRKRGDVGFIRERIGAIGGPRSLVGREYIDAEGLFLAPGFVDIHSHADRAILANPLCRSSLLQGITTLVAGNCGNSQAPLNEAMKARVVERARASGVEDFVPPDWQTFGEFLTRVEENGTGVNFAMFVGQGTIRGHVVGPDDREATPDEIRSMRSLVRDAMRQGALGLSAGRTYVPGRYAKPAEVAELCKEVEPFGGLYACHMKSEGDEIFQAIDELLDIAESSGCRPHIVHCKVVGRENWGKAPEALARIERAREGGTDLLYDVYPYNFAQVSTLKGMLSGVFPRINIGEVLSKLRRDPGYASALATEAEARMSAQDPVWFGGLPQRGVVWCQSTREHEFKSIQEIADDLGIGLVATIVWLAVENHLGVKTAYLMDEQEVSMVIRHPFAMISTDAATTDSTEDRSGAAHPRGFGTYPRVLGLYVRDKGTLSLEEAIRKMTSIPAERAGLPDRGRVREGYFADLTVFDKDTVGERGTLDSPCKEPAGIHYVFVNGKMAVKEGNLVGARAGKVLRR
jgi:N-acyl-D-amino-acid deacylase